MMEQQFSVRADERDGLLRRWGVPPYAKEATIHVVNYGEVSVVRVSYTLAGEEKRDAVQEDS